MRYGVCASIDRLEAVRGAGFDYLELPIARTLGPAVTSAQFAELHSLVEREGFPVEAGNGFFPAEVKVLDAEAPSAAIRDYVETVLERAARLGMSVAVFGSGPSRAIPEGVSRPSAEERMLALLRMMGELAAARGMAIAVEPLNASECNWLNTVSEVHRLVAVADHPAVRVLADLYHIEAAAEGFHGVLDAGMDIAHVHVSSRDRAAPSAEGAEWTGLFRALRALGYDARMSMECRWSRFEVEAPAGLEFLKRAWEETF